MRIILLPFKSFLIYLSVTWVALSCSTCLILNETTPKAVFEFFIYATEKTNNNNNNNNNNKLASVAGKFFTLVFNL